MRANYLPARTNGLRAVLGLEIFTIVYMVLEAGAGLGIGLATKSVSLQSFGLDSLIEIASALVLIRRITAESNGARGGDLETVERRAARLAGWLLVALGAYVLIQSSYNLYVQVRPDPSVWGILLAMTSLVTMPMLARIKLVYARRLGSGALRADAFESIACAYLAFALLLGVGANYLFSWWWADPLAAFVMVYFILKEAREALVTDRLESEAQ